MKKIWHNTKKELLILMRDLPGLAILFLMPVLLIIVVTLTQNHALQSGSDSKITLLFLDNDKDVIGTLTKTNLVNSNEIELVFQYNGKPLNDSLIRTLTKTGKYRAGIIIKAKTTEQLRELLVTGIKKMADRVSENDSPNILNGIDIYFDPAIRDIMKVSINNAIRMATSASESGLMTLVLFDQLSEVIETDDSSSIELLDILGDITLDELPKQLLATDEKQSTHRGHFIKPTITQNNVPAFSLFAMFFIVIPLAGSLITEKNTGTYDRIRVLPVSSVNILMGKTLAYLLVCIVQFILMLLIGIYLFPGLLGLPSLQTGDQYFPIFMATFASALAAIGFGLMVGTFSSTQNQAAMFGAILVVILAALGGIFMPVYMMPDNLKVISQFSPMRWGIDSYLDIFVRGTGLESILINISLLLVFYLISLIVAARKF